MRENDMGVDADLSGVEGNEFCWKVSFWRKTNRQVF